MLRVGLTGGIASGKTAVAAMLRDHECPVLEADPIGHELLEPGQAAYDEVVKEFGPSILDPAGKVNRRKLGAVVFADPVRRAALNQILHPRISAVIRNWFAALDQPDGPPFAIVEAALIVEANFHKDLDKLIVCWCTPEQQMERLQERGFTADQARLRISAQLPMEEKRRMADATIDCTGTMERTEEQIASLVPLLAEWAGEKPAKP